MNTVRASIRVFGLFLGVSLEQLLFAIRSMIGSLSLANTCINLYDFWVDLRIK